MSDYTAGFERWWKAYPAYKRKGKGDAFRKWQQRKLEGKTSELVDIIERQSQFDDHFKKYTPMPATYLHQGRYDDDVPKPPRAQAPRQTEVDENYEKDRYVSSVKKIAVNWLMRRHTPLPDKLVPTTLALIHSLAEDAKELHRRGELTEKYAQTIRDELNELVARHV